MLKKKKCQSRWTYNSSSLQIQVRKEAKACCVPQTRKWKHQISLLGHKKKPKLVLTENRRPI